MEAQQSVGSATERSRALGSILEKQTLSPKHTGCTRFSQSAGTECLDTHSKSKTANFTEFCQTLQICCLSLWEQPEQ